MLNEFVSDFKKYVNILFTSKNFNVLVYLLVHDLTVSSVIDAHLFLNCELTRTK